MPEHKRSTKKQILKRVSLTLFFCLISGLAFGTEIRPRNINTTIQGKVTDSQTNKVIVNAHIRLISLAGRVTASSLTVANGNYELKNIPVPRFASFYTLFVSKEGYVSQSIFNLFYKGRIYTFNFSLKPIPPNNPPKIISLLPQNRSTLIAGDNLNISVTASEPDRDRIYYRYLMDERIIQNWTTASSFSFKTTPSDRGRRTLKIEVQDTKGGLDSRAIDIYIFRQFPKPGS